jgi:hypothetical protein
MLHCSEVFPPPGHFPDGRSPDGIYDLYGSTGEWVRDEEGEGRWSAAVEHTDDAIVESPIGERINRRKLVVTWNDTNVIDPYESPSSAFRDKLLNAHVIKGSEGATIGEHDIGIDDDIARPHTAVAAFRCVAPLDGPPAPIVTPRAPYTGTPFDETQQSQPNSAP